MSLRTSRCRHSAPHKSEISLDLLPMQIHLKPNCVLDQIAVQHWSVGTLLPA